MSEQRKIGLWANPMLKVPALAKMCGKSENWIRDQLRSDDPPPSVKVEGHVQILWSDYVEWAFRKFGEQSDWKVYS